MENNENIDIKKLCDLYENTLNEKSFLFNKKTLDFLFCMENNIDLKTLNKIRKYKSNQKYYINKKNNKEKNINVNL